MAKKLKYPYEQWKKQAELEEKRSRSASPELVVDAMDTGDQGKWCHRSDRFKFLCFDFWNSHASPFSIFAVNVFIRTLTPKITSECYLNVHLHGPRCVNALHLELESLSSQT